MLYSLLTLILKCYQIYCCLLLGTITLLYPGCSSGSTCGELTIFLYLSYTDNSFVFPVLSAYRYTFGKPVSGHVTFRVCRNFEYQATTCFGEEAKAVCDEFSGQVSFEYSSGGVIGENVVYWACFVGITLLCWRNMSVKRGVILRNLYFKEDWRRNEDWCKLKCESSVY